MRVFFCQIYIEPEASFPFSHVFQAYLSDTITGLVSASEELRDAYGSSFNLVFNISAKRRLLRARILGPTVFRKTKDVEYTVFLPYRVITQAPDPVRSAVALILDCTCKILRRLGIDTAQVDARRSAIIEDVCTKPGMIRH